MGHESAPELGYNIVRLGDMPWEKRTEDNWPPLVKRVLQDPERDLFANIIWYARGVVEPRHVHPATHATWILVGSARMDGRLLGPGDLVYGPGEVPHGPLEYEMGCLLFGTLKGATAHRAVGEDHEGPATEGLDAHVALAEDHVWETHTDSSNWECRTKIMVNDPARGYVAKMVHWTQGSRIPVQAHAGSHAALIVKGGAVVGGQHLGPWDFLYAPGDRPHGGIEFVEDCMMIMNCIGDVATPSSEG